MLLQRTPYGKERSRARGPQPVLRASTATSSCCRTPAGRYESEGTFSKYHDFDATDGYDTVEWIAALPYTAGGVGMFGTSYGAHTQADAAKMNPPHLAGPAAQPGGHLPTPGLHKVRNHGAFELGQQLGWAFDQLRLSPDPVVRAAFEAEARGRLVRGDAPAAGASAPWRRRPSSKTTCSTQLTRADHDAAERRRPALGPASA